MELNLPSSSSEDFQSGDTAPAVAADLETSLFKAQLGLEVALCIGCLGCVVGLFFLRRNPGYDLRKLPIWTVIGSLLAVFLFEVFNLPITSQKWSKATDKPASYLDYWYPGHILSAFFRHVAICALFYLFYQMTHLCTYHSTGGTKPSSCIKIIHWVILSIIIGATVIDWAFYTDQVVRFKDVWGTRGNSNDYYEMMFRGQVMECVTQIIRWVASAEILAWNIFVVTKSMRFYPKLRVSSVFLLFGSVFFFALNMMWAIFSINYYLTMQTPIATSIAGVNLTQAIFFMVVYVGMLPFCMRWGIHQRNDQPDDVEYKNRRNKAPMEVEDNPVPLNAAVEAHSRDILEAGEPRQIFEADPKAVVFEADSQPLRGHSPMHSAGDVYGDRK